MTYSKGLIVLLVLCVFVAFSSAQQKIKIQGVWEIVSVKTDGKEEPIIGRQLKTITRTRFTWIYQDKDKAISLLAKKTHEDSLMAAAEPFGAGAGSYKLVANTYTETIELFHNPSYIGLSIDFTVKVEGDRMFQTGKFPVLENGKKVREILLEEVYKRIE